MTSLYKKNLPQNLSHNDQLTVKQELTKSSQDIFISHATTDTTIF